MTTEPRKTTPKKPVKKVVSPLHLDPDDNKSTLDNIAGSKSERFNQFLINQAINTVWTTEGDDEGAQKSYLAVCMAMKGVNPNDEVEGMLAAQMVGIHNLSMEVMRRSMISGQPYPIHKEYLGQASKLSRTFATLVEALGRYRNKDGQKVRVEHVHVHPGAQAVVGVVETPGSGGHPKIESQSHAQTAITHAPEQALRGEDESRDAVSVSGNGEWSL